MTSIRGRPLSLIGAGVVFVFAFSAIAGTLLYVAAPVGELRDTLVYRPAGSATPRETGLAAETTVGLDALPEPLLVALLFNEDKAFFDHHGFDFAEIGISIRHWIGAGRRLRGASTLTQQLARTIFLSRDRTIRRKVLEAIDTVKLERYFTKDEILLLYVNNVEWGPGVYGIAAAAAHYFQRAPADLEPSQCAFLVAILPNPIRFAAAFAKRRGIALRMQRVLAVLERAADPGIAADGNASDDPLFRIVPAVRKARDRATARRAGS